MSNNLLYKEIKGYYAKMNLDLVFENKVTFLYGDSGNGKTFLARAISEQDIVSVYFDYRYLKKEKREVLKDFIKNKTGFLIIIDNADIILDDELRDLIYKDKNNQFLIIGRDPRGLFLSKYNFVDINKSENKISFTPRF